VLAQDAFFSGGFSEYNVETSVAWREELGQLMKDAKTQLPGKTQYRRMSGLGFLATIEQSTGRILGGIHLRVDQENGMRHVCRLRQSNVNSWAESTALDTSTSSVVTRLSFDCRTGVICFDKIVQRSRGPSPRSEFGMDLSTVDQVAMRR
jgi:hypothetical protein